MRLRVLAAAACKAGPEAAGLGGHVPGNVFANAA